jgi:hypothetical protein
MATRRTSAVFAMAALLAIPSAAMAQRWGRAPFPGSGACFFQGPDFRGDYFCVQSGEDARRLPEDMNNRISSIRLFGRAEVIVFGGERFRGDWARFDRSVRDLRDARWDNQISSLRVGSEWREPEFREYRGRFDGDRFDRDDRGRVDRDDRGRPDRDDRGRFDGGRRDDRRAVDADAIVRRAYQDLLGRDPDEGGLRQYRARIIDDGWNEQQVRESIRSSPEYRDRTTMTVPKAQQIVRQAYLNVLKREPDPGSQGFVDRVFRDHWSQEQVEAELRKSPEFRQRNAR